MAATKLIIHEIKKWVETAPHTEKDRLKRALSPQAKPSMFCPLHSAATKRNVYLFIYLF